MGSMARPSRLACPVHEGAMQRALTLLLEDDAETTHTTKEGAIKSTRPNNDNCECGFPKAQP